MTFQLEYSDQKLYLNIDKKLPNSIKFQIEYFGFFGGIANAYKGGPTCAEVNWEFIFNFAEWGFIFFLVFFRKLNLIKTGFLKFLNKEC